MTTTTPARAPRFGGILWTLARKTSAIGLPVAGKRWNPLFGRVLHRGRRTGRPYEAPVAVRRSNAGFVVALAFGPQVDWHRNLLAAGGGAIRWRGRDYPVSAPRAIDAQGARATFNPVQRLFLRLGGIDGYVVLPDKPTGS